MQQLDIYIPKLDDLWFRQSMMADKKTMSYNVGFTPFDGYNPKHGTIEFPKERWQKWFDFWIGAKDRWYAYVVRKNDSKWIGDIAYRFDKEKGMSVVHIVIDDEFRGMGYSKEALKLLCENAKNNGIKKICNDIPYDRISAINIHKALGFEEVDNGGEYCFLVLDLDKKDN